MSDRYVPDDSASSRSSGRSSGSYGGRQYGNRGYGGGDGGGPGYGGYDQQGDDPSYRPRSSGSRGRSSSRGSYRQDGYGQGDPYGGYGQPGQPGPYGQPGQYGQNRPSGRSGQNGEPSYGAGSSGRPGSPGQPVWGQAAAYAGQAPRRRKSRRALWITLGVVAALLIACGGGGVFAATRYFAPAVSAGLFCGYVETQGYTSAYNQMSTSTRGQITPAQFTDAFTTLDGVEGKATTCTTATGPNSYNASLFGNSASVELVMTRATAGALTGSLHLTKESAGWRVDAIDSSLLGVNLGALITADGYCAALTAQQYVAAYTLLSAQQQAAVKQADFVQLEQWHDTVDGQVSACAVVAIAAAGTGTAGNSTGATSTPAASTPTAGKTPAASATPTGVTPTPSGASGNLSDTSATLTLSLTRGKGTAQQGTIALAVEGNAWKIGSIATTLQGSDLSALQTGGRFCADLATANYADAYTLGDSHFFAFMTQAQTAAFLAGTSTASGGIAWSACTLDASTYKLNSAGTQATYKMTITFTLKATGATAQGTRLFLVVKVAGVWKLHGISTA